MKKIFVLLLLASTLGFAQQITTADVGTATPVCVGSPFSVSFTTSGFVTTGLTFTAQISDALGSFSSPTTIGSGTVSPITATIPSSFLSFGGYKIRVITTATGLTYNSTTNFTLYKPATATLSGNATINVGDSTTLSIAFTGNSPWGYTFTNSNTGTTSTNPLVGYVKPNVSTTYQLQSVSNICGAGTVSGTAVVVVNPKITVGALASSYCIGSTVSVPFTVLGTFPTSPTYTVQLSNNQGSFANFIALGTGTSSPISVQIPTTIADGSGYQIRVVASLSSTTASSNVFGLKPKPTATISGTSTIDVGQSSTVTLAFTGDAPWSYSLSNGTTNTASVSPTTLSFSPTVGTAYTLQSVSNVCGAGTVSGSAKISVIPKVSVADLALASVCVGAKINIPFVQTGNFEATNVSYTAQLSDASGAFGTPVAIGTGSVSPLVVQLPASVVGGGYRIRVMPSATATVLNSPVFTIKPLPTVAVSGTTSIDIGQSTPLVLTFTGDAPWTYNLANGFTNTATTNPTNINVSPTVTTTFTVQSVSNACGAGTVSGSAKITVIPRVSAADVSLGNVCMGTKINIPFTLAGEFETSNISYTAQLSDATGSFNSPLTIGTGAVSPIVAQLPASMAAGSSYRVRVMPSATATTLNSAVFTIKPIPTASISGNSTIVFGETTNITLNFTGDSPWNYELSEGTKGTAAQSPLILQVKPSQSESYTIKSVSNTCGIGTMSGSSSVTVLPRLVTENIAATVCQGAKFDVKFGIGGTLPANTSYQVQLSDSLGNFSASPLLIGTGTGSPISSIIPVTVIVGNNKGYRVRVIAVGGTQSLLASEPFAVSKSASAVLSGGSTSLKFGDEAVLVIHFGGTPPWTYELSQGKPETVSVSPAVITLIPQYPATYTLKSVANVCGAGVVSGQAVVNVLISGINPKNNSNDLNLYPNPTNNFVEFTKNGQQVLVQEWRIIGNNGLIMKKMYANKVDIGDLENGSYILQAKIGGEWVSRKIIKQ